MGISTDGKARLAHYMNDVYNERSETIHTGKTGAFTNDELETLRNHTLNLIIAMMRRSFAKKADILACIEAKRHELTREDYARIDLRPPLDRRCCACDEVRTE